MVKEIKIEKMDELIDALGGGGGSNLPTPTSEDNGKVLGVVNSEYALKDDEGVDMTGAQAGQVLTAIEDMGGNIIQGWTTPDAGLPSISSSANGKVLTAQYDDKSGGYAAWVSNPIIKQSQFTSDSVDYSDKTEMGTMHIPPYSAIVNVYFNEDGYLNEFYPVDILYVDMSTGNVFISSDVYQKIVDHPNGIFIIYYFN